jgi:RNA polymerase sigma factor (sigma-70 family)
MVDEKELVAVILKGNLQAFELLVKEYQRLVVFVTGKIINNDSEIEDVCQEVFIKVYKNLGSFKFESGLSTWIARIAWTTAINHAKRDQHRYNRELTDTTITTHASEKADEQLDKKDVASYLNQLISGMPEHFRTVIVLYHLNEFSYEEIMEISGMPLGTIKNYLFRARKLLKEKLALNLKKDIV